MELKRVLGKDARSAAEAAIAQYGRDVLVISTTKVGAQVELILAIEETAPATAVSDGPGTAATGRIPPNSFVASGTFEEVLRTTQSGPGLRSPQRAANAPVCQVDERDRMQAGSRNPVDSESIHLIVQQIRQEFSDLRRELLQDVRPSLFTTESMPVGLQPLLHSLENVGVPGELRSRLLGRVMGLSSPEEAVRVMSAFLVQGLRVVGLSPPTRGIHAICGASGVGKTLTTIRMARDALRELAADQVAIVSYTDNRPGAWGQLQVMSSALGVGTYRARSLDALRAILQDLSGHELVLIDTSGQDFLRHGEELVALESRPCLHAVMPADASQAALSRVLTLGGGLLTSIIVSKLDESASPWPFVRALCNEALPVSGMSLSDQVSASLTPFDGSIVVEAAMRPIVRQVTSSANNNNMHNKPNELKSESGAEWSASHG